MCVSWLLGVRGRDWGHLHTELTNIWFFSFTRFSSALP